MPGAVASPGSDASAGSVPTGCDATCSGSDGFDAAGFDAAGFDAAGFEAADRGVVGRRVGEAVRRVRDVVARVVGRPAGASDRDAPALGLVGLVGSGGWFASLEGSSCLTDAIVARWRARAA